ncbi:MAG TPA: epoxyqueuosine reductase QueH [Candidatus Megaira endosymbiont of Hartmannula sinica]|nr:epoxyqueuosine reductase QueH [Candidatus Megaera endosymbiont of Hartmannula sinica]
MTDNINFDVPEGYNKVLMHSCCAPCSGPLIEKMHNSGIELTIFFYNPNIHPKREYEIRKNENIRYAKKLGLKFVDADYDVREWFQKAKGMEYEPERGKRCTMCFDMRFLRTALYAKENNYKVITSSLGISRWKNMQQINECGKKAAKQFEGISYWEYNWRKDGGAERMYSLAKEEHFYKQEFCGCIYSLRDSNEWRVKNGRKEIEIGKEYYN